MSSREPNPAEAPVEPLTRREREILALLAHGLSGPEIAEKLTLARSSVKWHIQQLYGKLGVNSKEQAIRRAQELGLLGAPASLTEVKLAVHSEASLPTGTVTFLFTDIEGSTQLWQRYRETMPAALARHHAILKDAITAHDGHVFQIVGDGFCAAFETPAKGVQAALAAQRGLRDEPWGETGPVRVRMSLHSGSAPLQAGDTTAGEYGSGLTLSRAARLMSAAHGGQILLSQAAYDLLLDQLPDGIALRDLGEHQLKDLVRPDRIYQVAVPDLAADYPALKSPALSPRHNLPLPVTHFFGREAEISQLKTNLAEHRLVTLTGPGGVGKTRLSLATAEALLGDFADGVWLVELAPLTDPALVPQQVAATLGLRDQAGQPILDTLTAFLHARQVLLVLDNCEHVLGTCCRLADTLLRACPRVRLLASSREPLGIAGEAVFSVPSLSFPDPNHLPALDQLTDYTAVKLFLDRVRLTLPDYQVTAGNAASVARICQRLDGIPLAIEMAAARVNVLSAERLAQRLDDVFRLLTGGSRTALPRQQTLRAAIDWSYQLLAPPEQALLQRLSVFSGGWTLEAAEQVCSADNLEAEDVLDVLARLVGKSLVAFSSEDGDAPRYRLLETIRQYAREKLLESGEGQDLRDRHLAFCLQLAEESEPKLKNAERLVRMKQLKTELDNFRGSLEWSLAERNSARAEQGLRLASTLRRFWHYCGDFSEGRAWLEKGLAALGSSQSGHTESRARALHTMGWLTAFQGVYAAPILQESVALYRQADTADPRHLSDALNLLAMTKASTDPALARSLTAESITICRALGSAGACELAASLFWDGHMAYLVGDDTTARARAEESCAQFRQSGDIWGIAAPIGTLGHIAARQGDYAAAHSFYEESLQLFRESEDVWAVAAFVDLLGDIDRILGDYEAVSAHSQESLRLWRDMGNKWGIHKSLRNLGIAAAFRRDYERARALLLESLALLHEGILADVAADYSLDAEGCYALALTLAGLSEVARARGQSVRAAGLLRAAEIMVGSTANGIDFNVTGSIADRIEYERLAPAGRGQLRERASATALSDGQSMTWEQAVELGLKFEAEA